MKDAIIKEIRKSDDKGVKGGDEDDEPFEEKMERLTSELSEMFARSHELENEIRERLGAIGFEL